MNIDNDTFENALQQKSHTRTPHTHQSLGNLLRQMHRLAKVSKIHLSIRSHRSYEHVYQSYHDENQNY